MFKRKFTKYAIYSIAVLSATLINQYLITFIKQYINMHGYLLVLADMLIIILIFAPAFSLVSKYTKKMSAAYLKTSKKVSNNKNGTWIGLLVALSVLFVLFALLRHHIDVVADLKSMVVGE